MPWEKSYDETSVLEAAMRAFWAHGYQGTSMNDLIKATGINRGSMYTAFSSKHDLFMQALHYYDEVYRARHLEQIEKDNSPLEAILAAFESAACKPADKETPWGCLLVNTALELSPHDEKVRIFIERSMRHVEDFFLSNIERAKQEGTISASLDSEKTAQSLLGLFLGLRVLTRAQARQPTIDAIVSQAKMLLE